MIVYAGENTLFKVRDNVKYCFFCLLWSVSPGSQKIFLVRQGINVGGL